MQYETIDVNNTKVQLTMVLKLQQLQRDGLTNLSYRVLEEYVQNALWKDRLPKQLYIAANDIMSITAKDIVQYLSRKAILEKTSLDELTNMIG